MRKMGKVTKLFCSMLILVMSVMFLQGCGEDEPQKVDVAGKIYTYTGDSFGDLEFDHFTIAINEDGTFSYYEGMLSSYIGFGKWSVEGDILTLTEDDEVCYPFVHYFRIDGDDLLYIEEGSSNFIYTKVKDGERFTGTLNAEH